MEVCKKELKRQFKAAVCVAGLLYLLFDRSRVGGWVQRVYSELAPGGFTVTYYADTDFRHPLAKRTEQRVARDYGEGSPAWGVPGNRYTARWEGWLHVPETADYLFFLQTQGGARFRIENDLVIDHWESSSWWHGKHAKRGLSNGVYKVVIEHDKREGPGAIRLRWAGGPVSDNTAFGVPYVRKERKYD